MKKSTHKKKWNSVYANAVQLVWVGAVTGVFSGAMVTLFTLLAAKGEELSRDAYAFVRQNPAFIPVLLLVLALGAFLIGVAVHISSVTRGCGIPHAEGGARGLLKFNWWKDAVATFSACLLGIFMGLSIGAEGPSVLIGACVGDGVASCSHRNEMIKRYQITGGACTGLAVAGNAPLTGMIFAFEEAHKRFTPEVFICAFSSVIFGMLTRTGIYGLLRLDIQSSFHSYIFHALPLSAYWYVLLAGVGCGLLGVAFYKFAFFARKLFSKIQIKDGKYNHFVRIAIAVAIGGIVSFLAADVMGGGHELIDGLGTLGGLREPTVGLVWTLVLVLLLKFLITGVNIGSGLPCGIFVPVLAIGACFGGLFNRAFLAWGMPTEYADLIVMICISALFATIVKAPLTAIVMICELTGSFAPLLPVIIAVSIGYIIGNLSKTDGIYEELLEVYEHETGIHNRAVKEVYSYIVQNGAIAQNREVRDILWPYGARVTEIKRREEHILPDGATLIRSGDELTIVCYTAEHEKVKDELKHLLE